jgi:hypothetical protein
MLKSKSVKVNLNEKATSDLKTVAEQLGIPETEVLRKGLALMELYATLKRKEQETGERSGILLREGSETRELLIA